MTLMVVNTAVGARPSASQTARQTGAATLGFTEKSNKKVFICTYTLLALKRKEKSGYFAAS